jgi:dTDP-4-dehydrorhamnose reductase
MLAEVISQMLSQYYSPFCRSSFSVVDVSGLCHMVSGGPATSWNGFAKKILENIGQHASQALPKPTLIPTTAEFKHVLCETNASLRAASSFLG